MRADVAVGWGVGRLGKILFWCDGCHAVHGPKAKRRYCGAKCPDSFTIFGQAPPQILEAARTGASVEEIVRELRASVQTTPVLPAFRYKNRSGYEYLIVHCKWCRTYHLHGADPGPGQANGHRACHCVMGGSPYRITGYILHEAGNATAEVIKDFRRRHARGVEPTERESEQ